MTALDLLYTLPGLVLLVVAAAGAVLWVAHEVHETREAGK